MQIKRGQMEISFGMIFSIIMIIAVLAVGFYVIKYFNSLSNCTNINLLYDAIKGQVEESYQATTSKTLFSGAVTGVVEYVCFGNLSQTGLTSEDIKLQREIKTKYSSMLKENIFLYPAGAGACSPDAGKKFIEHLKIDKFFCVKSSSGKIKMEIVKNSFDSLVTIQPAQVR